MVVGGGGAGGSPRRVSCEAHSLSVVGAPAYGGSEQRAAGTTAIMSIKQPSDPSLFRVSCAVLVKEKEGAAGAAAAGAAAAAGGAAAAAGVEVKEALFEGDDEDLDDLDDDEGA